MTGRGRPLRFLAMVATGWAGARLVWLWPEGATLPQAIEAAMPIRAAEAVPVMAIRPPAHMPVRKSGASRRPATPVKFTVAPPVADTRPDGETVQVALLNIFDFGRTTAFGAPVGLPPPSRSQPIGPPDRAKPDRWSASAWFVTRRGAPASGPILGGDQAGLRVAWLMDPRRDLSLYARATAPMARQGRELALGMEWQPSRLPVRLIAERRIPLDRGTMHGTAIGIVGGVDGLKLPHGFTLEAYGQGGVVARERINPFADGALRVVRQIAASGNATLELGAGSWGAVQRDSNRIDIGPSAVARLPVAGQSIRLALDWRERVAGNARPGSGPALTIGADF